MNPLGDILPINREFPRIMVTIDLDIDMLKLVWGTAAYKRFRNAHLAIGAAQEA